MAKLLTTGVAALGSTAVSVGSACIIMRSSSEESASTSPAKELLFKRVNDFEQNWKQEKSKCVKDLFTEGFSTDDKRESASTTFPSDDTTFFATSTGDVTPYKSCVIID